MKDVIRVSAYGSK